MKRVRAALAALCLACVGTSTTGCTTLFPDAQTPQGVLTDLVTDLQTLLSWAAQVWSMVQPLLPASSSAKAQTDYTTAVANVQGALDAIKAFEAGLPADGGKADAASLVAAAKAAADQLFAVVLAQLGSANDGGPLGADVVVPVANFEHAHQAVSAWR